MNGTWLLAAALSGTAAAQPPPIPLPGLQREESAGQKLARREKEQVSETASKYGVSEDEVRSLRARGMGWGEAERVLEIAARARRKPAEVAELRESGLGWTEISERYGLGPDKGERIKDAVGSRGRKHAEPARPAKKIKIRAPIPGWDLRPMPVLRKQDPREGRVEESGEKGLLGK